MRKLLALPALSMAITATGFTANTVAETWSPTGTTAMLSGQMMVSGAFGGPTVFCNPSGGIALDGSSATVGAPDLSFATALYCGFALFLDQPYNLEPSSLTSVTLQNVRVAGYFGACAGDLEGEFDQLTGRITFNTAILPSASPRSPDCVINGFWDTSPQISYTIP
ncbi:hypothetical protein FKG94_12905 [Exilibacterium tricleocarpae]|uniref:Uncharacterized protein n=1 Tax=Exilibacterium tricleocarpae TaxID=2591008 RepID=A0A545TNW3_9GAMM|nr:hypothetical protein [Exilibacterium tricleocarpae]TQV78909.1 hypothetical protein FKG94_12905 [Exilibacterium tricleocarpae]